MDEMNNNNPFDEQDSRTNGNADPYNQPSQNAGQQDPYNNPYNQPNQNSVPYGQPQQNPYAQQQNPYGQQQPPYNQPYQQGNTYNRQNIPQQGYSQPQYGTPYQPYQPYQPYAAQGQSTGMAVASLVLGIISICLSLFMWSFMPLFLLPIIGLILGIVFKTKHLPVGKGLSTAGIITSAIGLVLPIVLVIILAVLLMNHSLDGFMSEMIKQIQQTDPELYQQYYEMVGDTFPEWFEGALRFFLK